MTKKSINKVAALFFVVFSLLMISCQMETTSSNIQSFWISPHIISLGVNDAIVITPTIRPENSPGLNNIRWSSNNPGVARVSNGTVTAVSAGTARISASVTHNKTTFTSHASITVTTPRTHNDSIVRVNFTDETETITFHDLNWNSIFLLRINTSNFFVGATNTGDVLGLPREFDTEDFYDVSESNQIVFGLQSASEFSANPPPINRTTEHAMLSMRSGFTPPMIGDERDFWVEHPINSGRWEQRTATLRASGTHANIWIMNDASSAGIITGIHAQELSDKFDLIYPHGVNLMGYEYGGGPDGNGGMDGDPKIQILAYDIVDSNGNDSIAGYFWSKDFYTQDELELWSNRPRTNLAEIFYINAIHVIKSPDFMGPLLIHELQHMINWNEKFVRNNVRSETWYNEMLSMMAEDIISPMIGIPQTNWYHPMPSSMYRFLDRHYLVGITDWGSSSNISDSYAKAYAFGAYLMRNYGGPELFRSMLSNNTTNIDSINMALSEFSPGMDFIEALRLFGEAMIYSGSLKPQYAQSFDNNVTSVINGIEYKLDGFNIWTLTNLRGRLGPTYYTANQVSMARHSLIVQSRNEWLTVSGDITITLERPINPGIEMYLMVR